MILSAFAKDVQPSGSRLLELQESELNGFFKRGDNIWKQIGSTLSSRACGLASFVRLNTVNL